MGGDADGSGASKTDSAGPVSAPSNTGVLKSKGRCSHRLPDLLSDYLRIIPKNFQNVHYHSFVTGKSGLVEVLPLLPARVAFTFASRTVMTLRRKLAASSFGSKRAVCTQASARAVIIECVSMP
jgi:hypothetical protein